MRLLSIFGDFSQQKRSDARRIVFGAGDGNRTRDYSLEESRLTTKLHPHVTAEYYVCRLFARIRLVAKPPAIAKMVIATHVEGLFGKDAFGAGTG